MKKRRRSRRRRRRRRRRKHIKRRIIRRGSAALRPTLEQNFFFFFFFFFFPIQFKCDVGQSRLFQQCARWVGRPLACMEHWMLRGRPIIGVPVASPSRYPRTFVKDCLESLRTESLRHVAVCVQVLEPRRKEDGRATRSANVSVGHKALIAE